MVASRLRPKGGLVTPFGLSILAFVGAPSAIGSQDLAALVARQPAIAERPAPSRFSMISPAHGATFNMPRPMSAAMPAPLSYTLAGLDTTYSGMTAAIRERLLGDALFVPDDTELPVPNRSSKGDRLPAPGAALQPEPAARDEASPGPSSDASAAPATDNQQTFQLASADHRAALPPAPSVAESGAPEILAPETFAPQAERGSAAEFAAHLAVGIAFTREEADPEFLMARLYFGGAPMGETLEGVQPWQRGEEPKVETLTVSVDTDATTASIAPDPAPVDRSALPSGGESIASKGEVTGVGGMIKRAPGFDAEHGDWEYFYADKTAGFSTGRLANCIDCHAGAKRKDYVFSVRKSFE